MSGKKAEGNRNAAFFGVEWRHLRIISTKTRIQSSFHNHSFYVDLPHLQSITLGNDSLSGCIDPLNCPCSEAVTTTELIMQSIFLFISKYSNRFT